jgi:hypothetical protein
MNRSAPLLMKSVQPTLWNSVSVDAVCGSEERCTVMGLVGFISLAIGGGGNCPIEMLCGYWWVRGVAIWLSFCSVGVDVVFESLASGFSWRQWR